MSSVKTITVEVRPDKRTFRDFAVFDAFVLKKHWVRPTIFCAAMTVFAVAALLFVQEQPWLIAGVLLAVGYGLPAVYVLSFLSQVSAQAKKNRLSADKKVYTVTLGEECVTVKGERRENETLTLEWANLTAYRRKRCIYLYADKNRAFLLPDGQADVSGGELWEFISARAGSTGR